MSIEPENYSHRGGGNYGIVLLCPTIVAGDRLVYFDHNRERGSWVIRDFVTGFRLDNLHSPLTVEQIETDATHNEFPAWCNVETNPSDWEAYLTLRTTAVLRMTGALRPIAANPNSGDWRAI